MKKGSSGSQVITVLSNYGSIGSSYNLTLIGSGYTSGTELIEMYTCRVTVDSSGDIAVPMASGLPRVFMLASSASSFCGGTSTATTSANSIVPAPRQLRFQSDLKKSSLRPTGRIYTSRALLVNWVTGTLTMLLRFLQTITHRRIPCGTSLLQSR